MYIKGFSITDTKKSFPIQDHYCIAWHDPKSITWSWLIWWTPPWRLKNGTLMSCSCGIEGGITIKIVKNIFGIWHFDAQEKMMIK